MILHALEAGAGPAVVVLHGLFGAAANFGALQRRLRDDFRVITLDARNHGNSPHAPGMDYATLAADVAETLDAAGVAGVALIGHSMGGKIAMALALARPDLVTRLLVADVSPVRYPPHFRDIAAAMRAIPLHPGLSRAAVDAALADAAPDPRVRLFLSTNLRLGNAAAGTGPAWRIGLDEIAEALPDIERWDEAGRYDGPVLVLSGDRSNYVLPEHRALFAALFPHVRFAALRDAGHWLHADQPDAFLQTVRAFLEPLRVAAGA